MTNNKTDIKPLIDGYNSQAAPVNPPAAAIFNQGVTNEAGIREAADRRREHSSRLSR
jgi:hypothetical protein